MQDYLFIANLRIKNNLSQAKMAKLLNVSLKTYKAYENGHKIMKLKTLDLINKYFNISIDRLLKLTKERRYNTTYKKINYNHLVMQIVLIRKLHKLSQKELAKQMNINTHTLIRYEKGEEISIIFLIKFAKKFNISVDYLCGKVKEKDKQLKKTKISLN